MDASCLSNYSGAGLFILSAVSILLLRGVRGSSSGSGTRSAHIRTLVPFRPSLPLQTLVVDCTHPTARQITHHLKLNEQKKLWVDGVERGDSSTDGVINGIKSGLLNDGRFNAVSTNHFDIDSFLSVWCCLNPNAALEHEQVLRECARIGDFRELLIQSEIDVKALKIACWLNSEEKRLFYAPFEGKISVAEGEEEGEMKFTHFLPLLEDFLRDPLPFQEQWEQEYNRVFGEYTSLRQQHSSSYSIGASKSSLVTSQHITQYPGFGLVVVHSKEPLHYYSLFSVTRGFDIVLSCYSNRRYEVEEKYTTFIDLASRPSLPRIELAVLAEALNKREEALGRPADSPLEWFGNRITDSGPILRLESKTRHLSKAERYGHQFERPIFESLISPAEMEFLVSSYFEFAYKEQSPKRDWTWKELHEINLSLDWKQWRPSFVKP